MFHMPTSRYRWFLSPACLAQDFSPSSSRVMPNLPASCTRHIPVFACLVFFLWVFRPYLYTADWQSFRFVGLLDLFALPVVLWLAILRFGCFMAGCCWGDLTQVHAGLGNIADPRLADQLLTLPWLTGDWLITAVNFPAESFAYQQHLALGLIEPGASSSLSVHPTQLYELVLLVILLIVLRRVESRWTSAGMVALVTLCAYAALRFLIEFLRADNALVLGHLTSTQLICIGLVLGCAVCMPASSRMIGLT